MNTIPITPEDFVEFAETAGHTFSGYISVDTSDTETILFGIRSSKCPIMSIPRNQIKKMWIGEMFPCSGINGLSRMWSATIELNRPTTDEGRLFESLIHISNIERDMSDDDTFSTDLTCTPDSDYDHLYWRIRWGDDWKRDSKHRTKSAWKHRRDEIRGCGYETSSAIGRCNSLNRRAPCDSGCVNESETQE